MSDTNPSNPPEDDSKSQREFSRRIGTQEMRKVKAHRKPSRSEWFGFAMFGLIGWSVVTPTLLGAALGWWLDHRYPSARSWTLALLIAGLVLGCANAWHWVSREDRSMHADDQHDLNHNTKDHREHRHV